MRPHLKTITIRQHAPHPHTGTAARQPRAASVVSKGYTEEEGPMTDSLPSRFQEGWCASR